MRLDAPPHHPADLPLPCSAPGPPQNLPGAATANAVYCLRTILKDLMEQLNSAQLLAFIEVPPEALAPAQQAQQGAAEGATAAGGAAADGGGISGEEEGGGVAAEFAELHNGSLVQVSCWQHPHVCSVKLLGALKLRQSAHILPHDSNCRSPDTWCIV